MPRRRSIATWRQPKKNGYFESGIIYNNNRMPCDEIYFRWVIDDKIKWDYEMTMGEATEMIRGLSSALHIRLEKQMKEQFGKYLNKK